MTNPLAVQLEAALAALASMPTESDVYCALGDVELLSITRLAGEVRVAAATRAALVAAEVARRSAPELGHAGLAQAAGFRTPQELVRVTTGSTAREAIQAVSVGRLARGDDPRSWLHPVGDAVRASELSVAAADSIASGLGTPGPGISSDELAAAAQQLCDEASGLDADRLFHRAREVRADLDLAGTAEREERLRQRRSLRFCHVSRDMPSGCW